MRTYLKLILLSLVLTTVISTMGTAFASSAIPTTENVNPEFVTYENIHAANMTAGSGQATGQIPDTINFSYLKSTNSYAPTCNNRLRADSPSTVLSSSIFIDVGKSTASSRDVMLFDLSRYNKTDTISKATLSLYWYYPVGATRTFDTIVEIYRPLEWNQKYVTWKSRKSGTLWNTVGGNWYDKKGVFQGTTPYASLTFTGSKVPDNKYHDFDVTQLVQDYVSGKYKNTGFLLKAKTESGNYIAFYSLQSQNAAQRPKLTITL